MFLDDAILIERYTQEFQDSSWIDFLDIKTAGSLSVHINANREGMGQGNDHWIDYTLNWYVSETRLNLWCFRF